MYQLLQDALPYLFGFYLLDGLMRIEAGQIVLLRTWGGWRARGGGLALAGLWPAAEAARGYDPPLLIAESGFYVPRPGACFPIPRREDLEFRAFEPASLFGRDGRSVGHGGKVILKAPSEAAARSVVDLLRSVGDAPFGQRQEALRRWLARAGDLGRLRAQHERYASAARRLRVLATILFLALFGLVPFLLFVGASAADALASVAIAIVVLHGMTVWFTRQALRRTESVSSAPLLSMALFPPAAMHSPLVVTQDLFAAFHPLAVAAALLPAARFEALARRERHRLEIAREAARGTDVEGSWQARLLALEAIAAAVKVDVARVRAAPPRIDDSAAGYCPLCFTEYRAGFDACSDCGTALRAFSAS